MEVSPSCHFYSWEPEAYREWGTCWTPHTWEVTKPEFEARMSNGWTTLLPLLAKSKSIAVSYFLHDIYLVLNKINTQAEGFLDLFVSYFPPSSSFLPLFFLSFLISFFFFSKSEMPISQHNNIKGAVSPQELVSRLGPKSESPSSMATMPGDLERGAGWVCTGPVSWRGHGSMLSFRGRVWKERKHLLRDRQPFLRPS